VESRSDPTKKLNPPLFNKLEGDSDIRFKRLRFNLMSSRSRRQSNLPPRKERPDADSIGPLEQGANLLNHFPLTVPPGLDPGVHVDGRVKPGHDEKRVTQYDRTKV
jgi:hypothetical protein